MTQRNTTLGGLAQVLAAHEARLGHCEAAIAVLPVLPQAERLAGHEVSLSGLAQRMEKLEGKLSGLRTWLMGVLASSAGTLALLLYQQLSQK